MNRYLTSVEILDAEKDSPSMVVKAIYAKDGNEVKTIKVPELPELINKSYRIKDVRIMEDDSFITTGHQMISCV